MLCVRERESATKWKKIKCTLKLKIIQIIFWNGKIYINVWFEWHTTRFVNILPLSHTHTRTHTEAQLRSREPFVYGIHLWILLCTADWNANAHAHTAQHMDHIIILIGQWNCVTEISESFRCDTIIWHGVDVHDFFLSCSKYTHTHIAYTYTSSFKIMSLLTFTLRLMRDQLNANIIIFMCAWQQCLGKKNEIYI